MAAKKQIWKPFLFVFLGILIAGGLLIGGYLVGQGGFQIEIKTETASESSPSSENTLIPESTPVETANWEVYTNSKYGYRFQHPEGWLFSPSIVGDETKPPYVIRESLKSNNIDDFFVSVKVWDNSNKLSLVKWLQFMKDSHALALPAEDIELAVNFTVGGESAFRIWSDPLSKGQKPGKCFQACPMLSVYFTHGNKAFLVEHAYLREVDEISQETFRLLSATFKFLD